MDNIRSKASMTNFASSLREDELMISSSVVDPLEQSTKPRSPSKLGATDKSKGNTSARGGNKVSSLKE